MLSSDDGGSSQTSDGTVDVNVLIKRFGQGDNTAGDSKVFAEGVLANIGQDEPMECPICFDVMDTPTIIPNCMHQWYVLSLLCVFMALHHALYSCKDCIVAFIETCREKGEDGRCPTCSRGPVKVRTIPFCHENYVRMLSPGE